MQLEAVITFIKNEKANSHVEYFDLTTNAMRKTVDSVTWLKDNYEYNLNQNNLTESIISKLKKGNPIIKDFMIWKKGLGVYSRQHLLLKFSKEEVEKIMAERPWTLNYQKDNTFGPELEGKDVGRYQVKWNNKKWLSYGPWLAFQRPKYFFSGPRLLVREITTGSRYKVFASYAEDTYYNNQSIFNGVLKPNVPADLFFILALINSTLFSYWQLVTSPKANRKLFPTLLMETVENFPLKQGTNQNQKPFIDLVDKILLAKEKGEDSSAFEKKIDELVYKLYELTPEEIAIIENTLKEK